METEKQMDYTQYIVLNVNDVKVVPLIQVEALRRERDALLIANKNLNTMLGMLMRCTKNVDNGAK